MSVTYPYVLRQGLVMTDNGEYFPGGYLQIGVSPMGYFVNELVVVGCFTDFAIHA